MHDVRIAYFVFGKKQVEIIKESAFLRAPEGGCPITGRRAPAGEPQCSPLRFGRMFKASAGFPPDLVICETKPESDDGFRTVAAIREAVTPRRVQAVFLGSTSYRESGLAHYDWVNGPPWEGDPIVAKPFNPAEIRMLLAGIQRRAGEDPGRPEF